MVFGSESKRNSCECGTFAEEGERDLACIMGHDDFVASAGWLQRFKERHDIVSRAVSSGAQSVDHAVAWVVKNVTATRKVQPKRYVQRK